MAFESVEQVNRLTLSFEKGVNEKGKVILKRESLNIRADSTDEDVNEVAETLAELVEDPLYEKRRNSAFVFVDLP